MQRVIFGIIPQVLPLWISFSLYRFESNVRSATVLGIVGTGGIGMILWEYIRGFYYAETSAVLIIIVGSVSLLDMASQRLRKMLICSCRRAILYLRRRFAGALVGQQSAIRLARRRL